MNRSASIEERLAAAFAVEPRAGFGAVDVRIAAVAGGAAQLAARRTRRRLLRILLLAAALIVLAGATVGAMRLLDEVARATPGTSLAWDRGVDIGQRAVSRGYAVTLVRGYADANQVVLGVSVEPLAGVRNAGPVLDPELRDSAGVVLDQGGGSSVGSGSPVESAEMLLFGPPTTTGDEYPLRLTLDVNGRAIGPPLTYHFTLPDAGGGSIDVGQSRATDAGVLTLDTVRISPTSIDASLHLEPSAMEASDWALIAHFNHGDLTIDVAEEGYDVAAVPRLTASTVEGVDNPAGRWTLVVTELVGDQEDGAQVRLHGPWVFGFEVP
jgi:hypothetical protein